MYHNNIKYYINKNLKKKMNFSILNLSHHIFNNLLELIVGIHYKIDLGDNHNIMT